MRIMEPVLPREMETAIPLEEALAMAAAYEEPVYGYAFAGGSAAGHQLEKTEYKACIFTNCRFTGAALSGAWFQNAVFENCDLSGAKLLEATLQKVRLRGCKLSGVNFAAAVLSDVTLEECVAEGAVFSEAVFINVLFRKDNLRSAVFWDVKRRSVFRFQDCCLVQAEFLHTSLNGQDLTTCNIEGAGFSGEEELRGAKVTPVQACELAKLLGVIIE